MAIKGQVERINDQWIWGSAYNNKSSEPVRVTLELDGHQINETWALQFNARNPEIRDGHTCFAFGMTEIWQYLRSGQRLRVLAEGKPLPVASQGGRKWFYVDRDGARSGKVDVVKSVAEGMLINKQGKLQPKVEEDDRWEELILPEYRRLYETFTNELGIVPFAFHGALLGVARTGTMIPHDLDLDLAYLSEHDDPEKVRAEFYEIQNRALDFHPYVGPTDYKLRIIGYGMSMTVCWFSKDGELYNSYGFVGEGDLTRPDFEPFKEVSLKGFDVAVPANPEAVSRYTYGRYWRYPDPGWRWFNRYKTRPDTLASRLSKEQVDVLMEKRTRLKKATTPD
jgi:hypothetical protein